MEAIAEAEPLSGCTPNEVYLRLETDKGDIAVDRIPKVRT